MDLSKEFESIEFLKFLIRGMAEGVIFIDAKNITRLCNPVGGAIRGVRGDELVGKPFLDCHPKAVHSKVLKLIGDLKKDGKEVSRTVRLKGRFYEHSYSGVRDSKGKFLGVVAVSRDITDRVKLERDLKDHTERLEHSNQMKDLFADIMSHDFINPASIIKNFADLILDTDLSAEVVEEVSTIQRNAERLIEMIENARRFSKLEDVESITLEEKDLGALLKKSINEFLPLLAMKDLKISYKLNGPYNASVSPLIEDVFSNLVSNAIKYSPERGSIKVNIEDRENSIVISISDQAEKISPEYRSTVFERFKRVGKQSVKGSGLGLAIVKRIVDLHNGKVWVEDYPKGGNIFYVEIPKNS
jgi:two-component system phosphate regulon sensor histidine kinase PhoR